MLNQGTGVVCLPHADSALLSREFQFGDLTGSKLKGEIVTLVGWGRTLYSSSGDQAVSFFSDALHFLLCEVLLDSEF